MGVFEDASSCPPPRVWVSPASGLHWAALLRFHVVAPTVLSIGLFSRMSQLTRRGLTEALPLGGSGHHTGLSASWSLMEEPHHLAGRLYPQLQSPKPGLSCFLCFPGDPRPEPLEGMKRQSLSEIREGPSVVGSTGGMLETWFLPVKTFFSLFFKTYFGYNFSHIVKIAFSRRVSLYSSPRFPRITQNG